MLLSKCTYKSKQEKCLIETISILFPMQDAASFFNNVITSVLYNQKVFSPLVFISNWQCFTCATDTNLHWGETWWRTAHSARKHGAISPIYLCYPAENWYARMFVFRENACCVKLDQICVYCCWASCENWRKCANELNMKCIASNPGDAGTRIMMHKWTNSCPDKWAHRWLASLACYL